MKVFFKKECELQEQMQHMTKADGVCPCTIYDVRCTIWNNAQRSCGNIKVVNRK